jgi:predicted nucleic acid-binding protein
VKRYVAEEGSQAVRETMASAGRWLACRVAFVETARALALAAGAESAALRHFRTEWRSVSVVEIDQELADRAAALAVEEDLSTLDSLHLASALLVADDRLRLATWDQRLWTAARRRRIDVLPDVLAA